jgi:putative oxidoreductase
MASVNTPRLASLLASDAPAATILIRLAVGGVFLSEGIQKFLDPAGLGAGRFARIGIPWPEVLGPIVGGFEVFCGALVLAGLLTRLAAVPLATIMVVAILSTKLPVLLGHGFWGFTLRQLPSYGVWAMAHEARADFAMLLGALFLLCVGAGPWAADRLLRSRRPHDAPTPAHSPG